MGNSSMALDAVFRMKGATPKDMNEVAAHLIESEKKYLPAPRIGCTPDINIGKIQDQWIARPPLKRHDDAVFKQLVAGCNKPKHVRDLLKIARGEKEFDDRNLSTRRYFEDPDLPKMVALREECDECLQKSKEPASAQVAMPITSAGEIGRLAGLDWRTRMRKPPPGFH